MAAAAAASTPEKNDVFTTVREATEQQRTRTFYVKGNILFGRTMTVYDLTPQVPSSSTSTGDDSESIQPAPSRPEEDVLPTLSIPSKPHLIVSKTSTFSRHFRVTTPDDPRNPIAVWHASFFSYSKSRITFPDAETAPDTVRSLDMRKQHVLGRDETFAINSVPYSWEWNSLLYPNRMTLFKYIPQETAKVAEGHWHGSRMGSSGYLTLYPSEVPEAVALITALVMLRKRRQRMREQLPLHVATLAL